MINLLRTYLTLSPVTQLWHSATVRAALFPFQQPASRPPAWSLSTNLFERGALA